MAPIKLRAAPESTPDWVGRIEQGEPFELLRRYGDYVRVRAGAQGNNWREGWLKVKYVQPQPPPPPRGPIFQAGDMIDRFVVTQYLSTGGQAEAYRTQDPQTKRPYVIKVFIDDQANDTMGNYTEARARLKTWFLREEVIMKQVQMCPYVVRYETSGLYRGLWFVAMQALAESLWALRYTLQRRVMNDTNASFAPETVARVGVQVMDALQCVHKQGFAHRDMKPSNLLVGIGELGEQTYLLDFGLAQRLFWPNGTREPASKGKFVGTRRYASINAHRRLEITRRDDLSSLFYVLMELALGNLPWARNEDKIDVRKAKEEYFHRGMAEKWLRPLPSPYLKLWRYIISLYPELTAELSAAPPTPAPTPAAGAPTPVPTSYNVTFSDPPLDYDRVRAIFREVCGECKDKQEWMRPTWPRKTLQTPAPPAPPPAEAAGPKEAEGPPEANAPVSRGDGAADGAQEPAKKAAGTPQPSPAPGPAPDAGAPAGVRRTAATDPEVDVLALGDGDEGAERPTPRTTPAPSPPPPTEVLPVTELVPITGLNPAPAPSPVGPTPAPPPPATPLPPPRTPSPPTPRPADSPPTQLWDEDPAEAAQNRREGEQVQELDQEEGQRGRARPLESQARRPGASAGARAQRAPS
eukprot:TRINITY_DN10852_c0_g1_i1.p1 TRINITY_DN10852_c0_g1~~TRINITY_DN10852_c0_g1_i1.p1  ORF type:complete len:637 (+),score=179.14 TRINITY_DN10852_c0_g1_i1:744-2654(+)